jgi:outer membrane protein TolC
LASVFLGRAGIAAESFRTLTSTAPLPAQLPARVGAPERRIGLKEMVKLTIEHNYELALAETDVAQTLADLVHAEGSFDFDLGANASYARSLGRVATTFSPVDQYHGDLTLSKRMGWNGTVSLSARGDVVTAELLTGRRFSDNIATLQLTILQPLLRDAGHDVAYAGIDLAALQREIQALTLRAHAAQIVRDVVYAYVELVYAQQTVEIRKGALQLSRDQLKLTEKQIDVGRVTEVEAIPVKRAISQHEEELVVAQRQVFDRSIELRRLIGLPLEADAELLVAADRPSIVVPPFEFEAYLVRLRAQSPALKAAKRAEDRASLDARVTADRLKPRIDLRLFGGPQGGTTTFDIPSRATITNAAAALVRFADVTAGASLVFDLPFQNRVAEGEYESALVRLKRAQIVNESLESQLRSAALIAINRIRSAAQRVALTRAATRFAGQAVDAERVRFSAGRTTNFSVLQREDELADAQLRELRPLVDYMQVIADLEALSTDILERYDVHLPNASVPAPPR